MSRPQEPVSSGSSGSAGPPAHGNGAASSGRCAHGLSIVAQWVGDGGRCFDFLSASRLGNTLSTTTFAPQGRKASEWHATCSPCLP